MKKAGYLHGILILLSAGLASAQIYGSSVNLSGLFDSSLIIYGGLFVIFFTLINFLLGRSFLKGDEAKTSRAVISLVVSIMSVYGLSTGEFVSGIGTGYVGNLFVGNILPTIITIVLIAGIVFFIWKWGLSNVLMTLGILSVLISLTNIVYEKNVFFVLGIIFLIIGLLLKFRKPKFGGWKWQKKGNENLSPEQQKIVYEKTKRNVYDLQQKYEAYKMTIFRTNLNPHKRRRMLRAMYLIRNQLRKLGASQPGQPPEEIERTLRNNRLI